MSAEALRTSRLLPADVVRVGAIGLHTRRMRAALSALGIAIGIASMVAVLGLSDSSKARLLSQLDRLGTNLLTVAPGQSFLGDEATLAPEATTKIAHMSSVENAAAVYAVSGASVRRSPFIDPAETNGIAVEAAGTGLLRTLGGAMASGRFLTRATERYPAAVLGAVSARRLGIDDVSGHPQLYIANRWYTVVGILEPLTLAPDIDRAALIGLPQAESALGTDPNPTTIYLRARPDDVQTARDLVPPTADPDSPEEVEVSRPSDALAAKAEAKSAFTSLFLGLGAVALLVGGVGIANVMVISVLERRSEIGLRRALGATRRHIAVQFLAESLILASLGGVAGATLGALVTVAYAASRGWPAQVPPTALAGGILAALAIGAVAGLYPATRAARMSPTDALRGV
jgi:putative ABC transport system permease protein